MRVRYRLKVLVAALAVTLGSITLPETGAAQFGTRPLRLRDYFAIEQVGSPAISPDGSVVAFVRSRVVAENNRRHSQIWVAATDGLSAPRRLTSPAHDARDPVWSPDGRLLAFRSERETADGKPEEGAIWFLDVQQGGEAFQIEGVWGRPVFSPDGRWIAFGRATTPTGEAATLTRSGHSRYELVDEFEREVEQHFEGQIYDWTDFRFDRRGYLPDPRDQLASPPRDLYVLTRAGGKPRRLTRLGVDVDDIAWDPRSERLLFSADEHQRDEHSYERHDLWMVDLNGELTRLTDDEWVNDSPAWSPDGEWITFRRAQGLDAVIASGQAHGSPVDLYRMPAGGGSMVNLTEGWDLRPGSPVPSRDGRTLYFAANVGGEFHLFGLPAAGGAVTQITSGKRWLGGFSFSADFSRMAYTATSSTAPAEVYGAAIDTTGEIALSRFNEMFLLDAALSQARAIRYASTDGTEIEGWVILPRGYSAEAGPYPLILAIHGGPHSAYGERFSFPFQLWATAGYIVLYVNPRGSTGYGEDFLWATWGGWGNLDYEDVMAGLGYALERWAVDPDRLGVSGYSYGGFLTNWVITHTDRFAAAVSGAGISNWISDYGTADIPRTKESEFFGTPWHPDAAERLWQQSPLKHAGGVSTPTLFVHGEADFRVPIEQGEQMYRALRKQKVPARFVRYPRTSHGGWRPWDVVHRYLQEKSWWEEHFRDD